MNIARSLVLSVLATTLGALLCSAAPALATYAPAAPASFAFAPGSPAGVAIDQSHKVVYVSNEGGRTVGKFVENGKGEFEEGEFSGPKASTFEVPGASILYQLAVDESAGSTKGDIYASDFTDGKVFRYTEAGVPAGEVSVGSASGVAVNSAGDLFVAGFESGVVLEFAPDGKPMNGGSPVIAGLSDPNAIALNGAGDLYVAEVGGGTVEFIATAPGVFESTPLAVGASVVSLGVSVDRSTNDVFVDYGSSIEEFDEAGGKVGGPFIPGGLGESNAIAVRESTKAVLATNRGAGAVDVFVLHPLTASTEPASEATKTTAKLHAKVALEGGGTIKYHFAYGTSTSYGANTGEAEVTVTAGSDEAEVTAEVTGLNASEIYHYKIVATDAKPETAEGGDEVLHTLGPPEIESESTSPVPPSEANPHPRAAVEVRLEGVLNPNNEPTECHFQYGTEASLKKETTTTPCEPPAFAASFGGQGAGLNVGGLEEGKTYYYRVVAKNAAGETLGTEAEPIKHFETALAPSTPEQAKATGITANTATLNAVLNPADPRAKEPGTYEFVYRQSEGECRYILSSEEEAKIEAEREEARELGDTTKKEEKQAELKADRAKQAENKSTPQEPGSDAQGKAVEAGVSALRPGFAYTYCLLIHNEAGEEVLGGAEVFTTLPEAPTVTSESVSTVEPTEATLNAQIDPNGAATEYHFEYLTDAKFKANGKTFTGAQSTPVTKLEGSLTAADTATAKITPLEPATTYHYQVVATNVVGGKTETTYGEDKTFTTPVTPSSEPSQGCVNEQARAEQPFGQTLPDCRAYEMVSPVQSEGQDATDSAIGTVPRAAVSGEALAYASRGAFGTPPGANSENELVSRREANGWGTRNITPLFNPTASIPVGAYPAMVFTPDLGEGLTSSSASLLKEAPTPGRGERDLYLASFATGEYRYIGQTEDPMGASTDLSRVVFGEVGEVSEWQDGAGTAPVSVNNEHEPLSASVGDAAEVDENYYRRQKDVWHAVSGDGSRVYFTSPGFDDAGAAPRPGTRQLFVRVNVGQSQSHLASPEANGTGTLTKESSTVSSLVAAAGYIDTGEVAAGASELSVATFVGQFRVGQPLSGSAFAPGTTITNVTVAGGGGVTIGLSNPTVESLSGEAQVSSVGPAPFVVGEKISGNGVAPGTTVAAIAAGSLTLSQPAVSSGVGVELRAGGECTVPTDACTVDVSASQRQLANPAGPESARYWGASADGSRTFFTSTAELTEDAYTGAHGEGANLYEYDLQTGGLTDLTGEKTDNTGEGAAVQGVVQVSEDGGYVYFVAKGALAAGASAGQSNLYLFHGGETKFVATLTANDSSDWNSGESEKTGPQLTTAVVSPGGGYLAFMSERSLTGYDNRQAQSGDCEGKEIPEAEARGTENCREVFVYDAGSDSHPPTLVCASCDPSGARPVDFASLRTEPGVAYAGYRPRDLLEDGTLFFNSGDALVPHASDGRQNVYEYEAGRTYAISNVTGGHESFFMDASPNGRDVFFATADQLLPEDVGNNVVVYDARIGGGFPVLTSAPACDNESSCKPPPAAPPTIFGAGPSETLSAPGNPTPPSPAVVKPKPKSKTIKCKRGFVKNKKGRCIKKKKSKKTKAKRSSNDRRTH